MTAAKDDALAYAGALLGFARRLTGDADRAEDLLQETYARAFAGSFAPGTNLRAWLFRIMRNIQLDAHKRDHRHAVEARDDLDDLASDRFVVDDDAIDRIKTRVSADIEAALASLPEQQRTVILLDLDDLTETEIAEVLGCAVGTVKSRLARARAQLRLLLRDHERH
jgi:RNA polymerase sigma-70 factor (ECF subfamily)